KGKWENCINCGLCVRMCEEQMMAKDIGGEVKIKDLKRAQMLKERGYIVLPDPHDPNV
ncbi:unnamed protein product, partial [marine sediment metagenome]